MSLICQKSSLTIKGQNRPITPSAFLRLQTEPEPLLDAFHDPEPIIYNSTEPDEDDSNSNLRSTVVADDFDVEEELMKAKQEGSNIFKVLSMSFYEKGKSSAPTSRKNNCSQGPVVKKRPLPKSSLEPQLVNSILAKTQRSHKSSAIPTQHSEKVETNISLEKPTINYSNFINFQLTCRESLKGQSLLDFQKRISEAKGHQAKKETYQETDRRLRKSEVDRATNKSPYNNNNCQFSILKYKHSSPDRPILIEKKPKGSVEPAAKPSREKTVETLTSIPNTSREVRPSNPQVGTRSTEKSLTNVGRRGKNVKDIRSSKELKNIDLNILKSISSNNILTARGEKRSARGTPTPQLTQRKNLNLVLNENNKGTDVIMATEPSERHGGVYDDLEFATSTSKKKIYEDDFMISEPLKTEPAYSEFPFKNRKIVEGIQQHQQHQTLKLENRNNMIYFQAPKQQLLGVAKTERKGRINNNPPKQLHTTLESESSRNNITTRSKGSRIKTEEDVDPDYYKIRPMIIQEKRDDENENNRYSNIKRQLSKSRNNNNNNVQKTERSSPNMQRLKLSIHRIGKERQLVDSTNTQILSLREYSTKEDSKIEDTTSKTSRSNDRYSNIQRKDLALKRLRQK